MSIAIPEPEKVTTAEAWEAGYAAGRQSANRYHPHSGAYIDGWTKCRKCGVNLENPHTSVCIGRQR